MATPNKRAAARTSGEILTADETADLLRVNRKTVIRLFEANELPAKKVGIQWRCLRASVDKFMEAR